MLFEVWADQAKTTVNQMGGIGLTDVSFTVLSAALFPSTGNFRIKVDGEVMMVTAVVGNVFTVTRAIEGYTASTHPDTATVTAILTRGSMETLMQAAKNLADLADAAASRTNLGLGSAATHDASDFALSGAGGTVTNVTGTSPVAVATGTTTPVVSMHVADATHDGYLAQADWVSFSAKLTTTTGDARYLQLGNNLSDLADAGTARTNLGLGTAATFASGSFAAAVHTHSGADITSGTVGPTFLGTGSPGGTNFLRGDGVWAVPSGTGMSNPMSGVGDLIVGGTSGAANRLGPASDGQVLTLASGTPSWATVSGQPSRGDVAVTTGSLADGANENGTIALGKFAAVLKLVTDRAAWVRLYATSADRTADATRLVTADPVAGTGVLFDVLTSAGALTVEISPPVDVYNNDGTPATSIYYAITNKSGGTHAVTATFTRIVLEI